MVRATAVAIVDDDPAIRLLLRRSLRTLGYRVHDVGSPEGAPGYLAKNRVDLLILGTDEPLGGGTDIIRTVRYRSLIPILVLSTRADEDTAVRVLESGADDFMRKPFGDRELLARVKNALRRRAREEGITTLVVTGDLEIDLLHRRIRSGGREVHVSPRPYEVLRLLTERAGTPITNAEILLTVWGPYRTGRVQYVRLAIRELRRKLEPDPAKPRYILTEVGVGYRLEIRDKDGLERTVNPSSSEERS
jgi:two-component system KDP operon response regulator KdpE